MKHKLNPALVLVLAAASGGLAAAPVQLPAQPDYRVPAGAARAAPVAKAAGTVGTVGTPMVNAYRSYPPSCAAYPLPDKPVGTTWSATVPAYAVTPSGGGTLENLVVTVWRVPCSSSGRPTPYGTTGGHNAITLVRADRADDAVTAAIPLRPRFMITKGTTEFGVIRVAQEPNTVVSEAAYAVQMPRSETFVLENYAIAGAAQHDFNAAFKLNVLGGTGTSVDITVPAYEPTEATYPDAFAPLPLDGYAAAQWYNPERNEGLIVQVAEGYDVANPRRRQVVVDLLTKDGNEQPFWIVGSAAFDPVAGGVRALDIPVSYLTTGNATLDWGRIHVSLHDCTRMDVEFTPNQTLAAGVPVITGTISYTRLLSANGMLCE